MAIIISTNYGNYRFNAIMSDTFFTDKFRGSASSSEEEPTTIGGKTYDVRGHSTAYAELNAAFRALRKWVDSTELEEGKHPVTKWELEYIGQDHKGVGIVRAYPTYGEAAA